MKVKSHRDEPASAHAHVGRNRVPGHAVERRTDSRRPSRFWSLLLPPIFRPGVRK